MENIKIEYEIQSSNDKTTLIGSFEFNSRAVTKSFLENAVTKSIEGLKKDRSIFMSGILNVFINNIKKYHVVFMGDPKGSVKPKIYSI